MKRNLQEQINRMKEIINEDLPKSDSLFGGKKVNIPDAGGHAYSTDWQSRDAWDIPQEIGTPVFAITSGKLKTFTDYGEKSKHYKNKTVYGQSFTVKSNDGNPDVYYTHLMNSPLRKNDEVKCGDLVGYIMNFPNSPYDHVHIGVSDKKDIKTLIDSNGKMKCGKITPTYSSSSKNEFDNLIDKITNTNLGDKLKKLFSPGTELSDIIKRIIELFK